MSTSLPNPRVGVAAVIVGPDERVVFGRRKGSHGAGQWAFPGGHLEHGESFVECAERETMEETGLKVKGLRNIAVTNDVFEALGTHYITIFIQCEMLEPEQVPKVLEPDKCEEWVWLSLDDVRQKEPEELFLPIQNLLKQTQHIEKLLDPKTGTK